MALLDLFAAPSLDEVQAKFAQFAEAAKLIVNSWYSGAPGEQLYQAFTRTLTTYVAGNGPIIRGMWLEYATDPGDPDPFDANNVNLDPEPGWLSALGKNAYYTERPGATLATTTITFTNGGNTPQTLAPGLVTVARLGAPEITYVTTANPAFYTDPGNTRTLHPGHALDVEVAATSPGTSYSANPGEISVLPSGWPLVTVTNAGPAIGTDRMSIDNYRSLCRTQAASVSPNGASDAIRRAATTRVDGSPLLQSTTPGIGGDGVTPVGITQVYPTESNTTGRFTCYFADDDGGASSVDVATANENITLLAIVSPGTTLFTGLAAINTAIVVTWAVEFQPKVNGVAVAYSTVEAAIIAALVARFKTYPIGGFKRTAGAGTISLEEIKGTVKGAHPAITDCTLSSPVGATPIPLGHKAKLTTPTGTGTAV